MDIYLYDNLKFIELDIFNLTPLIFYLLHYYQVPRK
jgi:hypothetical protein